MIDRTPSLSHSNGYYRIRKYKNVWITEPVDVLDIPVEYEVIDDRPERNCTITRAGTADLTPKNPEF